LSQEGKREALVAGVSVSRIVLGARHSRDLRAHGGAAFGARLDRVPHKAAARGGGNPESSSRQHRYSETAPTGQFGIALNQTVKPFTDVRVRKALTLAIDRYAATEVLYSIASLSNVEG